MWATEQLQKAATIERLLRKKVPIPTQGLQRNKLGEWKAQISLRVRQGLRRELEGVAERERRKLGNVAEALLEWAALQLRVAGSVDRLMKVQLTNKKENR
jgi:hypothetical protein